MFLYRVDNASCTGVWMAWRGHSERGNPAGMVPWEAASGVDLREEKEGCTLEGQSGGSAHS